MLRRWIAERRKYPHWKRRLLLDVTRHPLEWLAAMLVQGTVSALPIDRGPAIGGRIARLIGPRVGRSRAARRNLRMVFPDWDDARLEAVIADMWECVGRSMFEYAKLRPFRPPPPDGPPNPRVELVGAEHLDALAADGRPGFVVSAHYGNWELVTLAAKARGLDPIHLVYRPANNPWLDAHIRKLQGGSGVTLHAKGPQGARGLIQAMREKGHAVMLIDQRMRDGIRVPFFGKPAWTAPAVAELARRYDVPIVPVRVDRLRDGPDPLGPDGRWTARFRITVEPPVPQARSDDRQADVAETMTRLNTVIARWIRERPEQWLWIHKRWD